MSQVQNNILHNFVQPALFLSVALLAGSKRCIQYFPGATQKGLIFSAALGGSFALASQKCAREEEQVCYSFMRVTASLALGAIIAPYAARGLGGRADITLPASLRLGVLETVVSMQLSIVSFCIPTPPRQPTLQEQHAEFLRDLIEKENQNDIDSSNWYNLPMERRAEFMVQFYSADLEYIGFKFSDFHRMNLDLPDVADYSVLTYNQLTWEQGFFFIKRGLSSSEQFAFNQALNNKNLSMFWNLTSELVQYALADQERVDLLYDYYTLHPIELRVYDHDTIQRPLTDRFHQDGKDKIPGLNDSINLIGNHDIGFLSYTALRFLHGMFSDKMKKRWNGYSLEKKSFFNAAFARNRLVRLNNQID